MNNWRDIGDGLYEMPLTPSKYGQKSVIYDADRHEELAKYRWSLRADKDKNGRVVKYYAHTRKLNIFMHKFLFGDLGDKLDHINDDGLDNRASNVRCGDDGVNELNVDRANSRNKLGVRGVHVHPRGHGIKAVICFTKDGKKTYDSRCFLFSEYSRENAIATAHIWYEIRRKQELAKAVARNDKRRRRTQSTGNKRKKTSSPPSSSSKKKKHKSLPTGVIEMSKRKTIEMAYTPRHGSKNKRCYFSWKKHGGQENAIAAAIAALDDIWEQRWKEQLKELNSVTTL